MVLWKKDRTQYQIFIWGSFFTEKHLRGVWNFSLVKVKLLNVLDLVSHVALEVENVKKFYFLHLQYFLFIKECNQENVPYVKQVHQKSITYKFGFKLDETLRLRSPASI